MRGRIIVISFLLLAGCGKSTEMRSATTMNSLAFDVAQAPAAEAAIVSGPQIAYTYAVTYLVADTALASVQARQVALCAGLGVAKCRLATTTVSDSGEQDQAATGQTKLLVDARIAGAFQKRLDAIAATAGGGASQRSTTAEDVTKEVVDTDARVRAKQALADRLMRLIATANGKVADLVAAEQAFAATQEELDAARSLQATLRQRVAMSEIDIAYTSRDATGIWSPVRRAYASLGDSFGTSLAALVTFVVMALPWVLLLLVVVPLIRRLGWRWPFGRRRPDITSTTSPPLPS